MSTSNRRLAAASLICFLLATTLTACTGDGGHDCSPNGTALVTATGPDGQTWQRTTDVTLEPPSVDGGYVVVRHPCSWTALDLADGSVVREGEGAAVGVAGGFVYTIVDDGETVAGEPVVDGGATGDLDGISVTSPGSQQLASTVEDHVYIYSSEDGPVGLTQYAGGGDHVWDTSVPVLREPTLTPVGEVLVVTSTDGSVYGIAVDTGTVLWRALATTVAPTSSLSVRAEGDAVTVTARAGGADDAIVTVLDATTGERLGVPAEPDPVEQPLTGLSDGWRVDIESEPIYVMEG